MSTSQHESGPDRARHPDDADAWPPSFPHAEIDRLLARLRDATVDDDLGPEQAVELLRMVAHEAQRLRTAVTRRCVLRLNAAEDEAAQIVADAHDRFDRLRELSLSALDSRLDEAEALTRAMRQAWQVESQHIADDPSAAEDVAG